MKVEALHEPGPIPGMPLRSEQRPDAAPGPGELAVSVAACAVCRTDLQLIEGDIVPRTLPIVPGHQVVGYVVDRGRNVHDWEIGDRLGIGWLAGSCGTCSYCRTGRENLCEQATFTGWDRDGGYADRIVVRADFAIRLPDHFTDEEAAPLLCGGVIGYRALRLSGIAAGGRLGLYGFGASARLAIQIALSRDCEVFVATRSRTEQDRALAMGAAWAGPYRMPPPAPLDAAVTFAPVGYVVVEALKALTRGGTVAVNAIHLDTIPEFPYSLLWWERSIRSVANYTRADAAEFMQLAGEIPIRTDVERHRLEDVNLALGALKAGESKATAVLIP